MQHARLISLSFLLMVAAGACGDDDSTDGMCTPGERDCACIEGVTCNGSLVCSDGLCVDVDTSGLNVSDPAARSCEVIVVEDNIEVVNVTFGEGVEGTFIREAPRVAVTFHKTDDSSFGSGTASVLTTGAGSLDLRRATCFDTNGAALGGDPLSLAD